MALSGNLEGKTAAVTGAASGIWRACADQDPEVIEIFKHWTLPEKVSCCHNQDACAWYSCRSLVPKRNASQPKNSTVYQWTHKARVHASRPSNAMKPPMQALGAAMHKLAQICFGVVQHQQIYQLQVAT